MIEVGVVRGVDVHETPKARVTAAERASAASASKRVAGQSAMNAA
jgi:hypothetical protein